MSYLEDVENDILTDALNQATLAQVKGHINPDELTSLQDAIRVEEALQQVKTNRYRESPVQIQWGGPTDQQVPRGGGGGSDLVGWGTRQNQQVPTAGGGSNRGVGGYTHQGPTGTTAGGGSNRGGGGGIHIRTNRYPQREGVQIEEVGGGGTHQDQQVPTAGRGYKVLKFNNWWW